MPTQIEKLKEYLKFKANPALGLFDSFQRLKSELNKSIEELKNEIKELIKSEVQTEIEQREKLDVFSHIKPAKELAQKAAQEEIKSFKNEINSQLRSILDVFQQEKDKYTSELEKSLSEVENKAENILNYTKSKTEKILEQAEANKNAVLDEADKEAKRIIKNLEKMRGPKGERGADGKTPLKGVDYFTKEDIKQIVNQTKAEMEREMKIDNLTKEIKSLRKEVKELRKDKNKVLRQKILHRGGVDLGVGTLVGTGDGATKVFTLPFEPGDPNEVIMIVGGGFQFKDDDFTLSGRQVTFTTAPPDGAKVRVLAKKI